jgi:hypothetical protein
MNERIKELANQLGPVATIGNWGRVDWANNVYPQLGDKMYAAIDLEKFAASIIRECADFIDSHEQIDKYGEAMNMVYGEDLIKHFGVEK